MFLIPYSGSKVMRYIPQGKFIEFNADDALLLKDKKSRNLYFDRKFYTTLNRQNVKEVLFSYIQRNAPFELYEFQFKEQYLDKMQKGQKLILISYRNAFTMPLLQNWDKVQSGEIYKSLNMFVFLMSKITRDSIQLCTGYLKFLYEYTDTEGDYSIFVFEKQ